MLSPGTTLSMRPTTATPLKWSHAGTRVSHTKACFALPTTPVVVVRLSPFSLSLSLALSLSHSLVSLSVSLQVRRWLCGFRFAALSWRQGGGVTSKRWLCARSTRVPSNQLVTTRSCRSGTGSFSLQYLCNIEIYTSISISMERYIEI